MTRRQGFTLIELLVVIAIIGILAAMLFPVFARARESARKVQCLSNVKNIAMAFQLYLADYDRFPPSEHDQYVIDELGSDCWMIKNHGNEINPYLRIPVILDEYIKNRDVWLCPSGPLSSSFPINPCIPDWWTATLRDKADHGWYCHICMNVFPSGWGGVITDTYAQHDCSHPSSGQLAQGSFATNYATVRTCRDASTSEMNDVAKWVVVGDCGANIERWHTASFAYETDAIECEGQNSGADWVNCPQTQSCGIPRGTTIYRTDPVARMNGALTRPRHLGGANLGFADGHAKWMASEQILWGGIQPTGTWIEGSGPYNPPGDKFEDLFNCRFPPVSAVP